MIIITAWTGVYYVAFTLILGAAALLWRFAHKARIKYLLVDAIPFTAIGDPGDHRLPAQHPHHPGDPPLAQLSERLPYESVLFAGNLAVALLPIPQSSMPGFDFYNASVVEAIAAAGWGESTAITNHGTWITTLALIVILIALIMRTRRGTLSAPARAAKYASLPFITYLIAVTLLWFIPWGANYLFAGTVTAQIRAWNRFTPDPAAAVPARRCSCPAPHQGGHQARDRDSRRRGRSRPHRTGFSAALPQRLRGQREGCRRDHQGRQRVRRCHQPSDPGQLRHPATCPIWPTRNSVWSAGSTITTTSGHPSPTPASAGATARSRTPMPASGPASCPNCPPTNKSLPCAPAASARSTSTPAATSPSNFPRITDNLKSRFGEPVATGFDGEWLLYDITDVTPASPEQAEAFFHQPMITADPETTQPKETELETLLVVDEGPNAVSSPSPAPGPNPRSPPSADSCKHPSAEPGRSL